MYRPFAAERIIADTCVIRIIACAAGEDLEAIALLRVESAEDHRAVLAVGSEQVVGSRAGYSEVTEQFGIGFKQSFATTHSVGSELGVGELHLDISSSIGSIYNRVDVILRRFVVGNLFVANVVPIMAIAIRRGSNNATRTTIHTKVEVERAGNGFCIGETEQANSCKEKRQTFHSKKFYCKYFEIMGGNRPPMT